MRSILFAIVCLSCMSAQSQTPWGPLLINSSPWGPVSSCNLPNAGIHVDNKWHLDKYAGIATGFSFFHGGSIGFFSAPVGLQLSRELNHNLSAFTAISAAPLFFGLNPLFINPGSNKTYPGTMQSNANRFGLYSRVEMGLMYTNEERTFSISGSIGVDRGSYPLYPANRMNTKTAQPLFRARQ